jgi:pimeloyl-ACP methyl ester carboxylesterase
VSTPTSLRLPDGVRRTSIETSHTTFAALEALPGTGVCERQPALLVPGYTGSKEDFLSVLHQLAAAGRRVIAIDMRGQYETPGPADPRCYAIERLGADIADIISAIAARAAGTPPASTGPSPGYGVHLLGHSFGGLVAREALLGNAEGVCSLTLMSSGPAALTGPAAARLGGLLAQLNGGGTARPGVLRRQIERLWDGQAGPQAATTAVSDGIAAFLRDRMLRNSPAGLWAMGSYLLTAPDRTAELAQHAEVPVLVVYGEDDDTWEPAAQEEMAARLGAERVCIPGAAHSPAVEAPETTASALNMFWQTAEAVASEGGREMAQMARAGWPAGWDGA